MLGGFFYGRHADLLITGIKARRPPRAFFLRCSLVVEVKRSSGVRPTATSPPPNPPSSSSSSLWSRNVYLMGIIFCVFCTTGCHLHKFFSSLTRFNCWSSSWSVVIGSTSDSGFDSERRDAGYDFFRLRRETSPPTNVFSFGGKWGSRMSSPQFVCHMTSLSVSPKDDVVDHFLPSLPCPPSPQSRNIAKLE